MGAFFASVSRVSSREIMTQGVMYVQCLRAIRLQGGSSGGFSVCLGANCVNFLFRFFPWLALNEFVCAHATTCHSIVQDECAFCIGLVPEAGRSYHSAQRFFSDEGSHDQNNLEFAWVVGSYFSCIASTTIM